MKVPCAWSPPFAGPLRERWRTSTQEVQQQRCQRPRLVALHHVAGLGDLRGADVTKASLPPQP